MTGGSFVHLHCHFPGSYSDSTLKIEPTVRKAAEDGQPAVALTDHGEIASAFEFSDACQKYGIKPIYGAELYFVENAERNITRKISDRFHLVALAKDERGLRNLFSLVSDSWVLNSYQEKRGLADWTLLDRYREGLLILSGCYFNVITRAVARGGLPAGERMIGRFREIFGEDFYLEIGRHDLAEEDRVNEVILALAERCGMTPVLTNDAHYRDAGDWKAHEIIMKTRYDRVMDVQPNGRNFWFKTAAEMAALGFPPSFSEQTLAVAAKCNSFPLPSAPAPKRAKRAKRVRDAEALIKKGEAAYLGKIVRIDAETARRHVREVLKKEDEALIDAITGIPRRSEHDRSRLVCSPGRQLKEIVPLKRSGGAVMTQWDETDCLRAGAAVISSEPPSFIERILDLFR